MWGIRAALMALVSVGLSGCFELASRAEIHPDGSMTTHSDIAIDKKTADGLVRMMALTQTSAVQGGKSAKKAPPPKDFAAHCKDGFKSAMQEGVEGMKQGKSTKRGEPQLPVLKGGTFSVRGDLLVCTMSETLKEPLVSFKEQLAKSGLPMGLATLELLPGGAGYRFFGELRFADLSAGEKTLSEQDRAAMQMMIGMVPPDLAMTAAISGIRVENANGQLSADGKTVTWKIPYRQMLDLRPDAPPLTLKADVYFK